MGTPFRCSLNILRNKNERYLRFLVLSHPCYPYIIARMFKVDPIPIKPLTPVESTKMYRDLELSLDYAGIYALSHIFLVFCVQLSPLV